LKKPIKFDSTEFKEFNKRIQRMINDSNEFPDYRKVLKNLSLCNQIHNYKLNEAALNHYAKEAFAAIGKLLQERRQEDLYETYEFYDHGTDPAKADPELRAKLEKNKKHHAKIYDVIDE